VEIYSFLFLLLFWFHLTELTHETRESGIKRLTAVIKNKFDKKSWTNAKGCAMIPP